MLGWRPLPRACPTADAIRPHAHRPPSPIVNTLLARLRRLLPDPFAIDARERARSVLGALIGIFVAGMVGRIAAGEAGAVWLVAPMGASAILVFCAPASPLAQPWPVLGGNVVSALVGVACAKLIGVPLLAASVAVGAAIAAMFALRCLHPPGGAVALGAAMLSPGVAESGFLYALSPVGVDTLALLSTGIAYNRLCGRRYPHVPIDHAPRHGTADPPPGERSGLSAADLDAALLQYNQVLDISRDDLEEILMRAQMQAFHRRFGETVCADIMSRDVVTVTYGTGLDEAWRLLRVHKVKALPVIDRHRHVVGIVTLHDFLRHGHVEAPHQLLARMQRMLRPARRLRGTDDDGMPDCVGQIMTATVATADASQPIATLVPLFSDSGLHTLPVVDATRKLVGIVTQSDLVAALYQNQVRQAADTVRLRA